MSRYPRTCRNGHEIVGPEGECPESSRGRRLLTCRVCRLADRRRRNEKRVASGKHAEAAMRYRRRQADQRDAELELELELRGFPRSGVETKTKFTDT